MTIDNLDFRFKLCSFSAIDSIYMHFDYCFCVKVIVIQIVNFNYLSIIERYLYTEFAAATWDKGDYIRKT